MALSGCSDDRPYEWITVDYSLGHFREGNLLKGHVLQLFFFFFERMSSSNAVSRLPRPWGYCTVTGRHRAWLSSCQSCRRAIGTWARSPAAALAPPQTASPRPATRRSGRRAPAPATAAAKVAPSQKFTVGVESISFSMCEPTPKLISNWVFDIQHRFQIVLMRSVSRTPLFQTDFGVKYNTGNDNFHMGNVATKFSCPKSNSFSEI